MPFLFPFLKHVAIISNSDVLALSVLADRIVHLTTMVPGRTVEIEPVVRVATAHSNAILISTVIWFALAPLCECERIPIGPLEGALLVEVAATQPVAGVGVGAINDNEVLLNQIVLLLAGRLSQEAMVLDTALLSLKPVEASVVGSPTTGIRVLAAVGVIAVQIAVGVCRVAAPVRGTTAPIWKAGRVGLVLEVHVALVGALGTINPPIVGVTVRCS